MLHMQKEYPQEGQVVHSKWQTLLQRCLLRQTWVYEGQGQDQKGGGWKSFRGQDLQVHLRRGHGRSEKETQEDKKETKKQGQ